MAVTRRVFSALLAAALAPVFVMADAPISAPKPAPRPAVTPPTGLEVMARAAPSGQSGYLLVDLATGAVLEQLNADNAFLPASVAKAPTMVYALDALGPGHRFETRLLAAGPVQGGVLQGDLILQGGGDPELDSARLFDLARGLSSAGITRISGRFLLDQSRQPLIPRIDPGQPEHVSYNPSVGALNLNFNRVFLGWSRRGKTYDVTLEARGDEISPPAKSITFALREGGARGRLGLERRDKGGVEQWLLNKGALGRRGSLWLPVRRPAIYTGTVFRELAARLGVTLPAPVFGAAPGGARQLTRVVSRRLDDMGRDMLRFSTNMTAEALGRAAALARGEPSDTLEASGAAMSAWFNGVIAQPGAARFTNHSGLSSASRASPAHMLAFLTKSEQRLAPLMPDKTPNPAKGAPPLPAASVLAKTGTMYFGRGLSGYIYGPRNRRLGFAIFSTDFDRRAGLDRGAASARRYSPSGQHWLGQAKRFERDLLDSWIRRFAQ